MTTTEKGNDNTNDDMEELAAPEVSSESTGEPQSDASETITEKVSTQKRKKKKKNLKKKNQESQDSSGVDKILKDLNVITENPKTLRAGKTVKNSTEIVEPTGRGRNPVKNKNGGKGTLERFLSRSRSGSVSKRDRSKSPGDSARPKEKAHKAQ